MRFSFLTIFLVSWTFFASAQEFDARVKINTPKLQTADPAVFKTLEKAIVQLVNETAWTDDVYEQHERINTNITINITKENSATSFEAEILIQASRPVYNTEQETQLFATVDKSVSFSYEHYQPMEFSDNTFTNNMTSIIAFYCYVILGLDYDSFSPNGGSPYYQKAQDIFSNIPPALVNVDDGWSSVKGNNRNRYWLLENILSPRVAPMRRASYDYHLKGLDKMADDIEGARTAIANSIFKIAQVNLAYPNSMIVQLFAIAKGDEILQIFVRADKATKKKIYDAMIKIDATNASKYQPLL
jgi:hypothetical protein